MGRFCERIYPPIFGKLPDLYLSSELKALDARRRRHKLYFHYLYQIIYISARKILFIDGNMLLQVNCLDLSAE